jgi:hypothetical protein
MQNRETTPDLGPALCNIEAPNYAPGGADFARQSYVFSSALWAQKPSAPESRFRLRRPRGLQVSPRLRPHCCHVQSPHTTCRRGNWCDVRHIAAAQALTTIQQHTHYKISKLSRHGARIAKVLQGLLDNGGNLARLLLRGLGIAQIAHITLGYSAHSKSNKVRVANDLVSPNVAARDEDQVVWSNSSAPNLVARLHKVLQGAGVCTLQPERRTVNRDSCCNRCSVRARLGVQVFANILSSDQDAVAGAGRVATNGANLNNNPQTQSVT